MLTHLKTLYGLLDQGTRRRLPMSAALALVVALAEAFGIGMVFPLLMAVADPVAMASSTWLTRLYNLSGATSVEQFIVRAGGIVVALLIAKNLLAVAIVRWQVTFLAEQEAALATRMFGGYLRMPYDAFARRNSAELIQNSTGEVSTAISGFLLPAVGLLVELAVIFGLLAVVIVIDPVAALAIMTTMAIAALLFHASMRRWLQRIGERIIAASADVLRRLQEGIGAAKEIRVLGRAPALEAEFAGARRALGNLRRTQTFVGALPRVYLEIVLLISLVVVASINLSRRPLAEAVSVLALFGVAGLRLLPSVNRVLSLLQQMNISSPSVERIAREISAAQANESRPAAMDVAINRGGSDGAARIEPSRGEIVSPPRAFLNGNGHAPDQARQPGLTIAGLHYSYPERAGAALSGVSLHLPWGQSMGLVGPSGSGKSTLVDLLLGLRRPHAGRILVDGTDIAQDIAAWQRRIGYVPQSIALIDASIRRNIALGIPRHDIDDRRIGEVIELASLSELMAELPDGIDTIVGEHGARLSGGQRQRIGIARALYHDPDLLILDEATSALDNTTESKIAEMLGELAGVKTMIVVAHRLSTVRRCDTIAILAGGVCTGRGPYDELVGSNADFARLVRAGNP